MKTFHEAKDTLHSKDEGNHQNGSGNITEENLPVDNSVISNSHSTGQGGGVESL
jgi:hypothetical protein